MKQRLDDFLVECSEANASDDYYCAGLVPADNALMAMSELVRALAASLESGQVEYAYEPKKMRDALDFAAFVIVSKARDILGPHWKEK